jgi:hypothetical protein
MRIFSRTYASSEKNDDVVLELGLYIFLQQQKQEEEEASSSCWTSPT